MTDERDRVAEALPAYLVGEELGRGAFGVVWAGRHRRVGHRVAIKQLTAVDATVRARFLTEAKVLASLEHPHVVRLFDYVEDGVSCLLVMERLEGGTLGRRFSLPRRVDVASACAVAMVTCAGLHHAHHRGVLHRDVKPDNLLFSGEGVLKVTDFGIAKGVTDGAPDASSTGFGELKGTPAYMAPEQVAGYGLGRGVDIYATGLLLYELLSGELPFTGEGGAIVVAFRRLHEDPRRLDTLAPDIPAELADVTMQALNRWPADRFATAEDFGIAIGRAASAALRPGWLDSSRVALLAPGPILDSAHVARGQGGLGTRPGPGSSDPAGDMAAPAQSSSYRAAPTGPVFSSPDTVGRGAINPPFGRPDVPANPAPPPPTHPEPTRLTAEPAPGVYDPRVSPAGFGPTAPTGPSPYGGGWGPVPPPGGGWGPASPPPIPQPPAKAGKSRALIGGLIAALVVAVVVAAGVTAALLSKGGGGTTTSVPSASGAVITTTTTAPAPTTTTSVGISPAQAAATQLAGLLQQSNGARNLVVMATQRVGNCQQDPRDGIAQVQTAISERDAVIHNLGSVPLVSLPKGAQMVAALNTGLQASIEADRHYINWMTDMANAGTCPINDPALQAADAASQQATAAKKTFVGLWNPVAAQFQLTQYAEKDL